MVAFLAMGPVYWLRVIIPGTRIYQRLDNQGADLAWALDKGILTALPKANSQAINNFLLTLRQPVNKLRITYPDR